MEARFAGYPLKFSPVVKTRIWGGDKLPRMFGVKRKEPVGEIWTLSDHPSGPSVCLNGPLRGKTLSEIVAAYPELYLGNPWSGTRFPLLIKFLHAKRDLSVQIHPDDEYAAAHEGDFGKTEAWYILDAEPGARVIHGHTFADRKQYYRAIEQKRVKEYLKYRDVKKGDLIFVPSRTLHALLKGTTVIEIQQSSDVTYRVYDWDRVDENGNPRQLHIDKAADVMRYGESGTSPDPLPETIHSGVGYDHRRLCQCPYFSIEQLDLKTSDPVTLSPVQTGNPEVLIAAEGKGELVCGSERLPLKQGDTVLIPGDAKRYAVAGRHLSVLRACF